MLKASAKELLSTVRKAIANMNNWREKETTRTEMAKIIRDTLWHSLPTSYTDADMTNCRQKIYTFVVERSPMIAAASALRLVFMTNAIRGSKLFFRLLPLCCYAFALCSSFFPRKQRIPVNTITATATKSTT